MSFFLAPQLIGRRGSGSFEATGGIIQEYTLNGIDFRSHTFLETGDFTVVGSSGIVDVLVVSGGGSGTQAGLQEGGTHAGAGGAGGMVRETGLIITSGVHQVIVGAGGANNFSEGESSDIENLAHTNSIGGGKGGNFGANQGPPLNGGSGGGGQCFDQGSTPGGAGVPGQGNNGGPGSDRNSFSNGTSGGGGGAGAAGQNFNGGIGLENNFRDGADIFYAGGGAGTTGATSLSGRATGTLGGGGGSGPNGIQGVVNTGGGGAAMANFGGGSNGSGGSGIVVIRYDINQVPPE
jgi:hypothetical protein